MKTIRAWQATRQWAQLPDAAQRRPKGGMRWSTEARVLCLIAEEDEQSAALVSKMQWATIGINEPQAGVTRLGAPLEPTVIRYSRTSDKSTEPSETNWTPAQLNYAGHLRAEIIAPWREREFDFVINFLPEACPPIDHFCAGLRAHLKIAMHEECLLAYDLVLRPAPGSGSAGFVAELARYLRVLNPTHAK